MPADLKFKLFAGATLLLIAWSVYLIWVCIKIASGPGL